MFIYADSDGDENFLSLIKLKNSGGLLYPSVDVIKIIRACEKVFVSMISGDDFKNPKLMNKGSKLKERMRNIVTRSIGDQVFLSLKDHEFNIELGTEDLHSLQLTKKIADCYLNMRLLRYGQRWH